MNTDSKAPSTAEAMCQRPDLETISLQLNQTANTLIAISEAMFYSHNNAEYYSPSVVHCADFISSLAGQIEVLCRLNLMQHKGGEAR